MEIVFVVPTIEELWFKKELLSDIKTMSFNHAYGGCISFSKDKWADWYNKWIENDSSDYYYRYVKDDKINKFVGEVAYHYDVETKRYLCDIIILDKYRGNGYGTLALKLLIEKARNNGVKQLYDDIAIDNPSISLFIKNGFKIIEENKEYVTVCLNIQ